MTPVEGWREAGWQAGSVSQGDLMCLAPGMPIRFPSVQIPARSLHTSSRTQPPHPLEACVCVCVYMRVSVCVCLCEGGGVKRCNCMSVCV